jgi:hypothetical protein
MLVYVVMTAWVLEHASVWGAQHLLCSAAAGSDLAGECGRCLAAVGLSQETIATTLIRHESCC